MDRCSKARVYVVIIGLKERSITNVVVPAKAIYDDVMKLGADASKEYTDLARLRSLYSKIENLLSYSL